MSGENFKCPAKSKFSREMSGERKLSKCPAKKLHLAGHFKSAFKMFGECFLCCRTWNVQQNPKMSGEGHIVHQTKYVQRSSKTFRVLWCTKKFWISLLPKTENLTPRLLFLCFRYLKEECSRQSAGFQQQLNDLLNYLLDPAKSLEDWERIDWCRAVISGGIPFDEFSKEGTYL